MAVMKLVSIDGVSGLRKLLELGLVGVKPVWKWGQWNSAPGLD